MVLRKCNSMFRKHLKIKKVYKIIYCCNLKYLKGFKNISGIKSIKDANANGLRSFSKKRHQQN